MLLQQRCKARSSGGVRQRQAKRPRPHAHHAFARMVQLTKRSSAASLMQRLSTESLEELEREEQIETERALVEAREQYVVPHITAATERPPQVDQRRKSCGEVRSRWAVQVPSID